MTEQPNRLRLKGGRRFLVYVLFQVLLFSGLGWLLPPLLPMVLALGWLEGLAWRSWLRRSWALVFILLLPVVFGFPWRLASGLSLEGMRPLILAWQPALQRGLMLLLVFASAAWLSHGMSALDLGQIVALLFRPIGLQRSRALARAAGLCLAFIPWTRNEIGQANAAALLRGSNPRRKPLWHGRAMLVPIALRSLEKARHSADAVSLRDTGL